MESRLKQARLTRRWSQLRLIVELEACGDAKGLVMPSRPSLKTQVSRWENGHVHPQEPYVALLSEIYGRTAAELGLARSITGPWTPGPSLPNAHEKTTPEFIACLDELLAEYTKTDNVVGSAHLAGVVAAHVQQLESMVLTTRGALKDDVLRLCSRFGEFAGWLYQDAGQLAAAEQWTNRALEFAEGRESEADMSYVLMRKSAVAAECGEFPRAIGLALAAERHSERTTAARTQALALRQSAIAFALARDVRVSNRKAAEALEIPVHRAGADDHVYVTPAYVLMETGRAAAETRQYDTAADRLSTAVRCWPDGYQRDRALAMSSLALVEASRGNVDVACAVGTPAVQLAGSVSSARTRSVLGRLERRLAPHARLTVVSELLDRLREIR